MPVTVSTRPARFNAPDTGGPDEPNGPPTALSALSAEAPAAAGKCLNILMAFKARRLA